MLYTGLKRKQLYAIIPLKGWEEMSIVLNLYKQSLINRKNNAQLELIQNNARKLAMLGGLHSNSNLASVSSAETALDLDNLSASTELMAVNAELASLNNAHLDYMS